MRGKNVLTLLEFDIDQNCVGCSGARGDLVMFVGGRVIGSGWGVIWGR